MSDSASSFSRRQLPEVHEEEVCRVLTRGKKAIKTEHLFLARAARLPAVISIQLHVQLCTGYRASSTEVGKVPANDGGWDVNTEQEADRSYVKVRILQR